MSKRITKSTKPDAGCVSVEDTLLESEELFRSLYQNATIGMYRITPDGRILLANPALVDMLGYASFEELAHRNLEQSGYEPEYPRADFRQRIESQGEIRGMESVWIRKDGSAVFVRESAWVVWSEDHQPLYYEGTVEDITERKQAEAALMESQRRAQRLLDQQIAINQLAQVLGESLDLDRIYATIYQYIREIVDASGFFVSSFNEREKLIRAEYALYDGELLDVALFPAVPLAQPGQGTQSHVIHSGEPLYTPDHFQAMQKCKARFNVEKDGSISELKSEENTQKIDTHSALYLPMKVKGKVTGVMQLQSDRLDAYTSEDIELMTALANVAAIAVENAHLFQDLQGELEQRKRAEEKLRITLAEKEVLLREVHHRVKNNLQAIIYLIENRAERTSDEPTVMLLKSLQEQARTMALVYEQLFQAENLAEVQMDRYLRELMAYGVEAFGGRRCIELDVECEDLSLNVEKAMPCGLMVNELLTNTLKYAFPPSFLGIPRISVRLTAQGSSCDLWVSDNGIGLPQDLDWEAGGSMGLKLVHLWATHQLGGALEILPEDGTAYHITFRR